MSSVAKPEDVALPKTPRESDEGEMAIELEQKDRSQGKDCQPAEISREELEGDDFEGADGEIDSVSGDPEPHSEELKRPIVFPNVRLREGDGQEEDDDDENGEVIQASPELQDEQQTTKSNLRVSRGHHYPLQSTSEELSKRVNNLEAGKTDSTSLDLGTLSSEDYQQAKLDSQISLLFPQQFDLEDLVNPFSLEVRIRNAREQQDIAESIVGISQPQLCLEGTSRLSLPDLEEISRDQRMGSSGRAVENGFPSEVKERIRTASPPEGLVEDAGESSKNTTGLGEAVLLGALASGVNKPTWVVMWAVLVALVASLVQLLHVALKSGSWFVLLNVLVLSSIACGLILLLRWYISEIGLVSVDKQLVELNLTSEARKVESKTM